METGDSRALGKGPPAPAGSLPHPQPAGQRGHSGAPSGTGSAAPGTPLHRYPASNQLPPIQ
ncbi:hypothetical protein IW143_002524, partial [Coemansia sp. RSA 520]